MHIFLSDTYEFMTRIIKIMQGFRMQSNNSYNTIIFKDRGAKSKANLATVSFRSDCWLTWKLL